MPTTICPHADRIADRATDPAVRADPAAAEPKRVRPDLVGSPTALRRFLREVEAAARLRHPNVVAVHNADECPGGYYLAMEYVAGSDLGAVVRDGGPLPVAAAVDYARQAALGL